MQNLPEIFAACPTVYAVRRDYIIIVPVTSPCVMWVRVGDSEYYDDSNGILRSASLTHKMTLPMEKLDSEREYTVCLRRVIERKPYFSELGEIESLTVSFKPVEGDTVHIYHIADAHNRVDGPVKAGTYFGDDLDLLVLNGDLPNDSGDIRNFNTIHQIASGITGGHVPVVFSRGNHDTRGVYAELIADHTPTDCGRSYFTFRLGMLWGVVIDCGEDKDDSCDAYGHTICCHDFRLRETAFLEGLRECADDEYNAVGVKRRIVISHTPFTQDIGAPFNIEQDIYRRWCEILRETVKPDFILCGHIHRCYISDVGGENDHLGQPCPVIVGSRPDGGRTGFFGGAALTVNESNINVRFTDDLHEVFGERNIK